MVVNGKPLRRRNLCCFLCFSPVNLIQVSELIGEIMINVFVTDESIQCYKCCRGVSALSFIEVIKIV